MDWKVVDIESDNSEDDGEQRDDGSGESDADDEQNEGGVQMKTLRMKTWQGIQAKAMRCILCKCHWHATHLASLDDDLKDLGPIGHFRNPPAPAKGMALSRKVEGNAFELG